MQLINRILYIKKLVEGGLANHKEPLGSLMENETLRRFLFEQLAKVNFSKDDFMYLKMQDGFTTKFIETKAHEVIVNGTNRKFYRQWAAIPYLRIASNHFEKEPEQEVDEELLVALLEVINSYINFVSQYRTRDNKTLDDYSIGEIILKLPLHYVFSNRHYTYLRDYCLTDEPISIGGGILEKLYPRVLKSQNKRISLQTIRLLFDYQIRETDLHSAEAKIDEYYLKDFVEKFGNESFRLLGMSLFRVLFNLIEEIDTEDSFCFSSVHISSLLSEQNDIYTENISTIVVQLIKLGIKDLNIDQYHQLLSLISYYSAPFFIRLSLFIIGLGYNDNRVKDVFWSLKNPMNESEAYSELRFVIRSYGRSFTSQERKIFLGWLSSLELYRYPDETNEAYYERLEERRKYWKAVAAGDLPEEDYLPNNEAIFQDPTEFTSNTKRIITMDEVEILPLLFSREKWNGYSQSGIINDLRQLSDPIRKKLIANEQSGNYLSEVLWGLLFSYDISESNDWKPFLSLIKNLISQQRMWDFSPPTQKADVSRFEKLQNYNKDFWKSVTYTFKVGAARRDASFLNPKDCLRVASLLFEIEPKVTGEFQILNKGQEYMDAINSLRGSVYDTLIEIAVSLSAQGGTREFEPSISRFLQGQLSENNIREELLWILGGNLPKIGYMDINWIVENRRFLFERPEAEDLKVLKTYLITANTVYKDLYKILLPYYSLAIPKFSEQSNYTSKLIQHICISSHEKWEGASNLLDQVFENSNIFHIDEIIKYYGHIGRRGKSTNVDPQEILHLWQRVLTLLNSGHLTNKEELASNLMKWLLNFDSLENDLFDTINATTALIKNYPFDYSIVNYLKQKVDAEPVRVGQIINLGLSYSNGFDFTSFDSISEITRKLYEKGVGEEADMITIQLVERNIFFLVDEYAQHHEVDLTP